MNQTNTKRVRGNNFTLDEKRLLFSLVGQNKQVIENKKTDSVSSKEKGETWIEIARIFSAQSPSLSIRSATSLKKYYENCKEKLRKASAVEKQSYYKTGGGENAEIIKDSDADYLLSIINKKTVAGLHNAFDSDCITPKGRSTVTSNSSKDGSSTDHAAVRNYSPSLVNSPSPNYSKTQSPSMRSSLINHENRQENSWKKYTPKELETAISEPLVSHNKASSTSNKKKYDPRRRRPTVTALTSSHVAKKYDILLEKRIEIADNELIEQRAKVEYKRKKREYKLTLLELEIMSKRKHLNLD